MLEVQNLRSEIEMTKKQISPSFLSRVLNSSASCAQLNPENASDILVKLSKILRYQLYDCNREKVLLKSEIEFLTNYLYLEKVCYTNLVFFIHKDEKMEAEMEALFVSPLLFLPLVQSRLKNIRKEHQAFILSLKFIRIGSDLLFMCYDDQTPENASSLKIPITDCHVC